MPRSTFRPQELRLQPRETPHKRVDELRKPVLLGREVQRDGHLEEHYHRFRDGRGLRGDHIGSGADEQAVAQAADDVMHAQVNTGASPKATLNPYSTQGRVTRQVTATHWL